MPYTQDNVINILHCAKSLVVEVEKDFEQMSYEDALSLCQDQAIKNAVILDIQHAKDIDPRVPASAVQVTTDYIFRHYGKGRGDKTEKPSLHPRFQEHYAQISDTADRLRENIKIVKQFRGIFTGNITSGTVYTSKRLDDRRNKQLTKVNRFHAECLLSHLQAMYPEFRELENWENLNTRQAIRGISGDILEKLKLVSHGLAIKGTCEICTSWE